MSDIPSLGNLLDGFADPAVIIGLDYRIVAANRAYRERYGSISGKSARRCYEVSHRYSQPCDQAGETCPLRNSLETGQPQRVLHLHFTSLGEEHVNVETLPIRDEQGNIAYFLELLHRSDVMARLGSDGKLLGKSLSFNRVLELVQRVAPSDAPVLLLGESGTGKELVAKAVHDASKRANGPFVPLDCSGLTETLFESELFGHERGAFTGAQHRKLGLVEVARAGTLFLDEVGDIPLALQVKLLRLLETGTFRRVGSVEPQRADFRLICATHRDLTTMVANGTFRQDLYYRISAFPIHLPTLRERREDIPLLAENILQRLTAGRPRRLHTSTLAHLQNYGFPGNVRELRNILERASLLADGELILPEHLPDECRAAPSDDQRAAPFDTVQPLEEMEKRYLRWAAAQHRGDRRALAEQLGLSERTLYRKLRDIHVLPGPEQ